MRLRAAAVAAATASTVLLPFSAPARAAATVPVVAYAADTDGDGNAELWTRPADGSGEPAPVFTADTDVKEPALSPDGSLVAYLQATTNAEFREYRLYVRATDGTGDATLLSALDALHPSWSPDGATVAFSGFDWDTEVAGVYTVPAAGGALSAVPTTEALFSEEPSYSPSGRQLAVSTVDPATNAFAVDVITLSTGTRARLAGTAGGSDPVWSPDGSYVVFQKEVGCGPGLYRVPAGGGTPVPVRVVEGWAVAFPEFSADGTRLFWNEYRSPRQWCQPSTVEQGDIWSGNADGTGAARLADTGYVEYGISLADGVPGAPDAPDTTPPAAPLVGAATVAATTATLRWTADADATEFAVRRVPHGAPAPASPAAGTPVYQGAGRTATAAGLTTGEVYDLYVFALDAFGNASPPSAVRTVRPTPPPVLRAVPPVGVATPSAGFTVSWSGSAPSYRLDVGERQRSASGAWPTAAAYTTLAAATTATSRAFAGTQGHTYFFRVRGNDGYGNVTAYAGPASASVPLDDRSAAIAYGPGWTSVSSAARYLGTYRATTTRGAYLTARADTSRFAVIGDRCAACGQLRVYVDGVLKATVDTRAASTRPRQVLWSSASLGAIGPHTLRIVAVGTPSRPRVHVDGIRLSR